MDYIKLYRCSLINWQLGVFPYDCFIHLQQGKKRHLFESAVDHYLNCGKYTVTEKKAAKMAKSFFELSLNGIEFPFAESIRELLALR